jgi:TatD DNase family protein
MVPTPASSESITSNLRILLETDAPYMVPANIYNSIKPVNGEVFKGRLPLSHSAMIPWTADFVVDGLKGNSTISSEDANKVPLDVDLVMRVARENARKVYGV